MALGQAGAELRARSLHALPGVSTALHAGLPNQCCVLAPRSRGFPSFPARRRGRARPPPGPSEMPAGAALRLRGRRRAGGGGGGVEEPGPGSLPAYRTRK